MPCTQLWNCQITVDVMWLCFSSSWYCDILTIMDDNLELWTKTAPSSYTILLSGYFIIGLREERKTLSLWGRNWKGPGLTKQENNKPLPTCCHHGDHLSFSDTRDISHCCSYKGVQCPVISVCPILSSCHQCGKRKITVIIIRWFGYGSQNARGNFELGHIFWMSVYPEI